jgi:sugar lactone lactonase YvrE
VTNAPRRSVSIFIDGIAFPEGPRWRNNSLWFSDIHGHQVVRSTPAGKTSVAARLEDRPSGLGFLPDGRLLVVSLLDRRLLAVDGDGGIQVHADLSGLCRNFINDMVVDRTGRAYVGARNGGTPESASDSVIVVELDGRCRIAADDMTSPNGSVVTPDGQHLIVAETAVGRLTRFRIGGDGSLSGRETMAELKGRHIDGICLDAEGAVWGSGAGGGLYRIGADGSLLEAIEFPGRMVLACVLGGLSGKTLYLATTSPGLIDNIHHVGNDRSRDAGVNSGGRIETIEVEVPAAAFQ